MPLHQHKLTEIPNLPSIFKAFQCEICGEVIEWWQHQENTSEPPFYKQGKKIENFARAKIFESYPNKKISYREMNQEMRQKLGEMIVSIQ